MVFQSLSVSHATVVFLIQTQKLSHPFHLIIYYSKFVNYCKHRWNLN